VDVMPDGRVYVIAGGGDGWLSLSGISFTVGIGAEVELLNKWRSYGNNYRPATINKIGDACVLSGFISSGDWGHPFGRVPPACYPNQRLIFSANNHEGVARVDILQTGHFVWAGGARSHGWVSLDGISWCVGDGGVNVAPGRGWSNYGGEYRAARHCMVRNMCYLSGLVQNTEDWKKSPVIATLPNPCRPKARQAFAVNVNIASARIDVFPNGRVVYVSGKANWPWISLDGIKFVVADLGASDPAGNIVAQESSKEAVAGGPVGAAKGKADSSPAPKVAFRARRH